MNSAKHPDQQQLTAYRAGYYQDQPARQRELAAHLEQCSRCTQSLQFWSGLEQPLGRYEQAKQPWLTTQLVQRRVGVTGKTVRRSLRFFPVVVPVLVSIFAVLFIWRSWLPVQPAEIVAPNVPGAVVDYVSARDEMYANIDFYLWLDTQAEGSDAATTSFNPPG